MIKSLHGVVHGRMIELAEAPGLTDGQEVEVTIKLVPAGNQWGDGLRRCAGGMAGSWTLDDDRILEQIYQERKRDDREEIEK